MLQKKQEKYFDINFGMDKIFEKKLFAKIEKEETTNCI